MRIFDQWPAIVEMELKMAHLLTGDDKFRDLTCDEGRRSGFIGRRTSASDYRFGRTQVKHVRARARAALGRVNGYLKQMIEAIADAKVRRMERELELRGIRLYRSDSRAAARSQASK
jgi:hypothetical protein